MKVPSPNHLIFDIDLNLGNLEPRPFSWKKDEKNIQRKDITLFDSTVSGRLSRCNFFANLKPVAFGLWPDVGQGFSKNAGQKRHRRSFLEAVSGKRQKKKQAQKQLLDGGQKYGGMIS